MQKNALFKGHIMSYTTNSPILFIIFNRIDTAKLVLEAIAKVKPKKLYISGDGFRNNKTNTDGILESTKVKRVRDFVMKNISWDCEVKTRFLPYNVGCQMGVSSAIRWFFDNESQGIILEDDIVPNVSFFRFCDEMLQRYKDNAQIATVSGWSILDLSKNKTVSKYSYYFSKYEWIGGFGSWARAWEKYELENANWEKDFEAMHFDSLCEKKYWHKTFSTYFAGKVDTWDFALTFCNWKEGKLNIQPIKNMINTVGYNHPLATHTTAASKFENMQTYDLDKIIHPKEIKRNVELDKINFDIVFKPANIFIRVLNKIARVVLKKSIFKV